MSWRTKNDLGLAIISDIHDALKIEDHWAKDVSRGFMWWPETHAQKIWVETGMFHNAQSMFRVHAETELIRGGGRAAQYELALASVMNDATLSAICYEPQRDMYTLHSSVYFTQENLDLYKKLFFGAIALQVDDAHRIARDLSRSVRAIPAMSEHPEHGLRTHADPLIGSTDRFFVPYGRMPSKWLGVAEEWKRVEWAMDRQASSFESDHNSYLKAQFPWSVGDGMVELCVIAGEPNPRLGNGLTLQLKLPLALPPEKLAHTAMDLNHQERAEWLRCHMLGSWGFDDNNLQFEAFIPNTSFHEGLLEAQSLAMSIRAQWVSEQFDKWVNGVGVH